MELPTEVSEVVIDQASDNAASLRHLSLTCTEFLPRARYHLFASIVIKTTEQMLSPHNFLDARPWLPPLVHKVTLSRGFREHNLEDGDSKWIYEPALDIVPVHLLNRFPNLRVWCMTSHPLPNFLSFHRSALRCYKIYSGRIRLLQLSDVSFEGISDFMGLVSAFTNIHTLTCSSIRFRKAEENDSSQVTLRPNTLSQRLPVSTLHLDTRTSIRAVEYLLACHAGGATLSNLNFTFIRLGPNYWPEPEGSRYFERLENATRSLSRLASLTLVVDIDTTEFYDLSHILQVCASVVVGVEGTHLRNVRVEFVANPMAALGRLISHPGPSLDACKELEEALLVIPSSCILVHVPQDGVFRRVGRAEFWTPIIKRAFPRLNERGLVGLTSTTESLPDIPNPPGHEGRVMSLVASHDSQRIVTASDDGTIIIWDLAKGTVLQEWLAHGEGVRTLALSPDSRRLVCGGGHTLIVWAIDNDIRKIAELEGHTDTVIACPWSPDGGLIASGSMDGTVRVWDGATFQQRDLHLQILHSEDCPTQGLTFSPDSRYLAWVSGNHDYCIWQPLKGDEPTRVCPHPDRHIIALSFDPEGRRIITTHGPGFFDSDRGPDTCVIRIWDVATGAALAVLSGHSGPVTGISFSPDGKTLLSISEDDWSALFWDAVSGERLSSLTVAESDCIRTWSFSPDGMYVAYGMDDGRVRVCRTDGLGGSCVTEFTDHGGLGFSNGFPDIIFFPNSEFLISVDFVGLVHIRRLSELIG